MERISPLPLIVSFVFAMICTYGTWQFVHKDFSLSRNGVVTQAEVVRYDSRYRTKQGSTTYRYELLVDGRYQVIETKAGLTPGTLTEVTFDPEEPSLVALGNLRQASVVDIFLSPMALMGYLLTGTMYLSTGMNLLRYRNRRH